MCRCCDSQEVGLEAAILERVRNSSLVKWSCADNVAGLKRTAEAVAMTLWCCWVGERRVTAVKRWGNPSVECARVRMQA